MIGNIRTSFISLLDQSNWMDDASKNKAKEKVNILINISFKRKNDCIIGSSYGSTNWLSGLFK